MSIQLIKHPLISHKVGLMRQDDLSTRDFRQLAAEVGCLGTCTKQNPKVGNMLLPDNRLQYPPPEVIVG